MASRIASTFSAVILLCATAFGSGYMQLKKEFDSLATPAEKVALIKKFVGDNPDLDFEDQPFSAAAGRFVRSHGKGSAAAALEDQLAMRAQTEQSETEVNGRQIQSQILQIRSSPLYRDSNKRSSNWLETATEHLRNLFNWRLPRSTRTVDTGGISAFGRIVKFALITLLAAAILLCIYFFARQFSYKKSLRRKASALLEENEPERTADEWLQLADGLTAQGRFREAVRCLYLACLLRLDEADVARFERSQTNWEHLARIHASDKKPPSLDFRAPTQAFDLIWYGHRARGMEDVDRFKVWYSSILDTLKREAA